MASQGDKAQRQTLRVSHSFSRMADPEEPMSPSLRKRASTMQESGIPAVPAATPRLENGTADVFESHEDDEHIEEAEPELKVPSTFDELPVEIKLAAERFLERLSAKVHPTPFSADALSDLFQDFYERAAGHISTHIATLSSRIGRETPPASSKSSLKSARPRAGSGNKRGGSSDGSSGGEMLTVSEVADRKKARRLLEVKRLALEEAVERGVCERVYEKIWKHRTTDDDARDEKLRSRTAALALVGIGLKELHMDPDPAKVDVRKTAEEKEQEIYESLSSAREALQRMDNEHYPLGKLQHLTAAHKSIVETLSQLFPKTSSADEILPTLIYTLITSPPEGINVVSNLNFIQRFRASNKLDGEAAYCLVNLEAAISFLETVDLSSLRADEPPEGPPKSHSRPTTPITDKDFGSSPPMPTLSRTLTPGVSPVTATPAASDQSTPSTKPPITPSTNTAARPQMHQRRISALISTQADRLEVGRDTFLSAADKVYDSINGTLDNSLQFLFGRFKEQQQQIASSTGSMGGSGELGTVRASIDLPKTLEEARRLVSSPSLGTVEDENEGVDGLSVGSARSGRSSPLDPLGAGPGKGANENKMLELLGGRGAGRLRDRSADSSDSRSIGSSMSRRVTWDTHSKANAAPNAKDAGGVVKDGANFVANTINSINPLDRFGMPAFPRFGRAGNAPTPAGLAAQEKGGKDAKTLAESPTSLVTHDALGRSRTRETTNVETLKVRTPEVVSRQDDNGDDDEELNARETLAQLKKCKPPRKRFLEVSSANELKLGEVEELLVEYKRLAKVLGEAFAQAP